MESEVTRCGVFISYRHRETGWAATLLANALGSKLGPAEVFIDHRSIGLSERFNDVLLEGLRRSAVLVVLIGPSWDEPPLVHRLNHPDDWVRQEILLARELGASIAPVLVDRADALRRDSLPETLSFLAAHHHRLVRQGHDEDVDLLTTRIAKLRPVGCRLPIPPAPQREGVEQTRTAFDELLRRTLPAGQQSMGNRDRLVDLALSVLGRDDRLIALVPARLDGRPNGSATIFLTQNDVLIVDVDERFEIRAGEIRFPRSTIRRVECVLTRRLWLKTADVILQTTAGTSVPLRELIRDQARQLADHFLA